MLLNTRVLDVTGKTIFDGHLQIDPVALLVVAEEREAFVREQGADWAAGAVPYLAQQLVNALRGGQPRSEVQQAAIQLALATWLYDSIFAGLDGETFVRSDLYFTITHDGIVRHDRVLARAHV